MFTLYVFFLVLGGGLLALSLFGDVFDGAEDLDLDLDADLGGDPGGGEIDAAGGDVQATKILSLRTVVYTVFGFGGTGTVLSLLGENPSSPFTLLVSLVGGALAGVAISALFNYLYRSDSGARSDEESFVGLPARVSLPIGEGSPGSISVVRGDRSYRLRALPHRVVADEDGEPEKWSTVVIVEMEDGVARVSPLRGEVAGELPPA